MTDNYSSNNSKKFDLAPIFNYFNKYVYNENNEHFKNNECIFNFDINSIDNTVYEKTSTLDENNFNINTKFFINDNSVHLPHFEKPKKIVFFLRKKGRKGIRSAANIISTDETKQDIHTNISDDNIITKIQVSYINFLINLINKILTALKRNDLKFLYIVAKYKQENSVKRRKELRKKNIGDIIRTEISSKYKKLEKDRNNKVYEKIKEDGLSDIMDILNKKFLFFFDKIYYNNLRNFNLKDFGLLDLKIELPKNFELYENLLMKNKNDLKYDKYKMNMEQCIKDHFLGVSKDEDEKDD